MFKLLNVTDNVSLTFSTLMVLFFERGDDWRVQTQFLILPYLCDKLEMSSQEIWDYVDMMSIV